MSPDQVFAEWHETLKKPDDSIFYYHKNVDRILLGLAIFVIASRPLIGKLGKAEMLSILHLQVPDLITAWIDEDGESFKVLFPMVMTVAEGYCLAAQAAEKRWPANKNAIRTITYLLCNACGAGGDMNEDLAESLLDDIGTDGDQIFSEKIKNYGEKLLFLTRHHSMNIPVIQWESLNGWK